MPKPRKGESKNDYMSRCIPIVKGEGRRQDQAVAICNSMWERKDHDREEPDVADLRDVEIFASGRWNGVEYDEQDLDEIVTNFEKLREIHNIPLKLGHNDKQPLTDGQPALGWVDNLRRVGDKLVADFFHVPKVIKDLIKAKKFRKVSIELLTRVKHMGERYNNVLDAVAILGADAPAVNTLDDLDKFLARRADFSSSPRSFVEWVSKPDISSTHKETEMDPKDLTKAISDAVEGVRAEFTKEVGTLKSEISTLTKERDEAQAKLGEFANTQKAEKVKHARDEANAVIEEAVKDGKILPAQRDHFKRLFSIDDDDVVLKLQLDDLKAAFSVGGNASGKPQEGNVGMSGSNIDDQPLNDPEDELIRLTNKHMADHNVEDFTKAFARVAAANPGLHKAYHDKFAGDSK